MGKRNAHLSSSKLFFPAQNLSLEISYATQLPCPSREVLSFCIPDTHSVDISSCGSLQGTLTFVLFSLFTIEAQIFFQENAWNFTSILSYQYTFSIINFKSHLDPCLSLDFSIATFS